MVDKEHAVVHAFTWYTVNERIDLHEDYLFDRCSVSVSVPEFFASLAILHKSFADVRRRVLGEKML